MRPLGALLFGLLSDRYGRRIPLMLNVLYFFVIEVLCGFSPNYTFFLIMRALFGIDMGGEWGVGASLAMEAEESAHDQEECEVGRETAEHFNDGEIEDVEHERN